MAKLLAQFRENFGRLERLGWFAPGRLPVRVQTEDMGIGGAQAAVLFLIGLLEGEPHVLITKRSQNVTTHAGELT